MAIRIEPLPGGHAFGAVVLGVTGSAIDDPAVQQSLRELWIDKGLLVFRGTDGERTTQVGLSRIFGEFELHPAAYARLPGHPELTQLHYDPDSGFIVDIDGDVRGAYLPWHSDLIYVDRINRGGLLRAVRIPARGGATGFIDQIGLYARLPETLKQRIDGLNVIYHADFNPELKKFGRKVVVKRHVDGAAERYAEIGRLPYVAHPMVFAQAETGRKVLNVSPWFAIAIEGMAAPAGDALLAQVVEHCEDETNAYYHVWQPGDMVLWDNWRMLHCAYGVPPAETRTVERTTIKGDYQLGRVLSGDVIADHLRIEI